MCIERCQCGVQYRSAWCPCVGVYMGRVYMGMYRVCTGVYTVLTAVYCRLLPFTAVSTGFTSVSTSFYHRFHQFYLGVTSFTALPRAWFITACLVYDRVPGLVRFMHGLWVPKSVVA